MSLCEFKLITTKQQKKFIEAKISISTIEIQPYKNIKSYVKNPLI